MKLMITVFLGMTLFSLSFGYSISGLVKDSVGSPVSGVKISLLSDTSISTMSAGNGSFSFSGPTGLIGELAGSPNLRISLQGGFLQVFTKEAFRADAGVYDVRGRLLNRISKGFFKPGETRLLLPAPQASGVYFVRVRGPHTSVTAKAVFLEGSGYGGSATALHAPRTAPSGAAKILSRPLTISGAKSGYLTAYVSARDTAANVEMVMYAGLPTGNSGTQPAISMAEYLDGKSAVVTMTFDDNQQSQLDRAVPLFNEHGYKGTFYLIVSGLDSNYAHPSYWDRWKTVAAMGHEIGNHSYGHDMKCACPTDNINNYYLKETVGAQDTMARKLGIRPLTFAFPGGGETAYTDSFALLTHIDTRTGSHLVTHDRNYPEGDNMTETQAVQYIKDAIAHKPAWTGGPIVSWFLFYMHDVTVARAAVLHAMFDFIQTKDDSVWCTTYLEATRYQRERERSTLQTVQYTANSVTFTVTNTLDPAIFITPVTVIINTGAVQPIKATAYRAAGSAAADVKIGVRRLLVNVAPGAASTRVVWE